MSHDPVNHPSLCVTCNSWLGILEKTEWTEKAWGYLNEVQRLKGER